LKGRLVWVQSFGLGIVERYYSLETGRVASRERSTSLFGRSIMGHGYLPNLSSEPPRNIYKIDFSCAGHTKDIQFLHLEIDSCEGQEHAEGQGTNYLVPRNDEIEQQIGFRYENQEYILHTAVETYTSQDQLFFDVDIVHEYLSLARREFDGAISFIFSMLGVVMFFWLWYEMASINATASVERGLRTRLSAIQFEVAPGPHGSQSIRAANFQGVTSTGDFYDWLAAAVECLSEDDQASYSTPGERKRQGAPAGSSHESACRSQ
jgi:hypothetical protein